MQPLPLSTTNAHPRDKNIVFDEGTHTYTVVLYDVAQVAPTSATKLGEHYFSVFDAGRVISQNYEKWKANANSKYHCMIHAALRTGSDEAAKAAIAEMWSSRADVASRAGTQMHADCELVCNGVPPLRSTKEIAQLLDWMTSFQPHMRWEPHRTEQRLYYEDAGGHVVVAGTPDLLLKSAVTGEFALVDFKRSDPAPKYHGAPPELLGSSGVKFARYALPPLDEFEDSKFGKYELQLNVLSHMLRTRYGIDVGRNMYILQLHEGLETWHCVRAEQRSQAVEALFRIETERLHLQRAAEAGSAAKTSWGF